MVQLTRSGAIVTGTARDLEVLTARFDRDHGVRLPAFLNESVLSSVQSRIEAARFEARVHQNIGIELCLIHDPTSDLLHFLVNDPRLFYLVQQITGCHRIGCFLGRVYRMVPDSGHYDSWHSDRRDHRLIGMSINLSTSVYDGGVFHLRDAASHEVLFEAANTGAGDAILFRIDDRFQHRITTVEGTAAKTAFAGWFQSEPEFLSLLTSEGRQDG